MRVLDHSLGMAKQPTQPSRGTWLFDVAPMLRRPVASRLNPTDLSAKPSTQVSVLTRLSVADACGVAMIGAPVASLALPHSDQERTWR